MYTTAELLALVIVCLGVTSQAFYGLGFGLVAAPLLFIINPAYVPAPILILGCVLAAITLIKSRTLFKPYYVWYAIVWRGIGAWFGAMLIAVLSNSGLTILFGLLVILAAVVGWARFSFRPSPITLSWAGFLSGVLGTATSVGGPPLAIVYQNSERRLARDDLTLFFFWGTLLSIIVLYLAGRVSSSQEILALKMMPAVLLGLLLAQFLETKIKSHSIKPIFTTISLMSGAVIIIRGLLGD